MDLWLLDQITKSQDINLVRYDQNIRYILNAMDQTVWSILIIIMFCFWSSNVKLKNWKELSHLKVKIVCVCVPFKFN